MMMNKLIKNEKKIENRKKKKNIFVKIYWKI